MNKWADCRLLVAYGFHMVIVCPHRVTIGFPYGFRMDGHKKAPPGEGEASWIVGGLAGVFDVVQRTAGENQCVP